MHPVNITSCFSGQPDSKKCRIYRELWHKAGNYEILTNFPLHLDIELSSLCNLKCKFCFQNELIEGPLGLMKFDLYRKIIDEGAEKGLCAVKLQVRGESFLHPELDRCIEYAKQKGILDVQITTNGTLLTQERIDKLLTANNLDAIILSVDSHHSQCGEQRQEGTSSQKIEDTVQNLLTTRARLGLKRPWVRLRASIPGSNRDAFNKTKAALEKRFPLADIIIVGRIHNFRDNEDAFPDLHENYELNPCSYLTQRLAVFWDGDVTTCCMDYNNRFKLGNIHDQTVEDIWSSSRLNSFRMIHLNKNRKEMPICKHCHACVSVKENSAIAFDDTKRHLDDYSKDMPEKGQPKTRPLPA